MKSYETIKGLIKNYSDAYVTALGDANGRSEEIFKRMMTCTDLILQYFTLKAAIENSSFDNERKEYIKNMTEFSDLFMYYEVNFTWDDLYDEIEEHEDILDLLNDALEGSKVYDYLASNLATANKMNPQFFDLYWLNLMILIGESGTFSDFSLANKLSDKIDYYTKKIFGN